MTSLRRPPPSTRNAEALVIAPSKGPSRRRNFDPDESTQRHIRQRVHDKYAAKIADATLRESLVDSIRNPTKGSRNPQADLAAVLQKVEQSVEIEIERERNRQKRMTTATKIHEVVSERDRLRLQEIYGNKLPKAVKAASTLSEQTQSPFTATLFAASPPLAHGQVAPSSSSKPKAKEHTSDETLLDLLLVGSPFDEVDAEPSVDTPSSYLPLEEEIVTFLKTRVLTSKECYKVLLGMKGPEAQRVLDLFHDLLSCADSTSADHIARRSILMALLRMSASSGLYPQQLKLRNIERESTPVTAGQFGEVWRGRYKQRPICIKVLKLYQRSQIDKLQRHFSREAIVWSQLTHPNVLPFHGIYHLADSHGRIGLVSPWMSNGRLPEYLKQHPGTPRLPFVHNVLAGLQYLHQHQVVHGDLKGVNILINSDGSACLADFGLSAVMDADILKWTSLETMTRVGGTVRWAAPEVIEDAEDGGLIRPSFPSDIYSLASVMYEVFSGQIPYFEFPRDVTVISKVIRGIKPLRPDLGTASELTDSVWGLMLECWNMKPKERPKVEDVIRRLEECIGPSPPVSHGAQSSRRQATRDTISLQSDLTFLMNKLHLQ